MACACKVNQEIEYLQKKYGHNMPKSKSSDIRGMATGFFKQMGILVLAIPFLPVMLVGILVHLIVKKEKPIKIDKIFKLNRT